MAGLTVKYPNVSPCICLMLLCFSSVVTGQDGELTIFVGDMSPAVHEISVRASQLRTLGITNISRPIAIDYDDVHKELYWTDVLLHQIFARNMLTSITRLILTLNSSSVLDGLAVDVTRRKLFYTDSGNDVIGVVDTDGNNNAIIIAEGHDQPRAIVLHETVRKMYWTDWGQRPFIAKADYDGSNLIKIVKSGLIWPNGLTLDNQNNVLYWCDGNTNRIETVKVDGTDRRVIITEPGAQYFDIFFLNDYLFFTDWQRRAILSVPASGGAVGVISTPLFVRLTGIHVSSNIDVSDCRRGQYGIGCRSCGHCRANSVCDRTTGLCLAGCSPGYQDRECLTPCSFGRYGENCNSSCFNCLGGGCDNVDGTCTRGCSPGFHGHDCKTACPMNTYGASCVPCGFCANGDFCDVISGNCPNGCQPDWTGSRCDTDTRGNEDDKSDGENGSVSISSNHVLIIGAVAGGFVVLLVVVSIVVVIVFIYLRRKRSPRGQPQPQPEPQPQPKQNPDYCTLNVDRQSNIYTLATDYPPAYEALNDPQFGYSHLNETPSSGDDIMLFPGHPPRPQSNIYDRPISLSVRDGGRNFNAVA